MDIETLDRFAYEAGIKDSRYPVSGSHVWLPYGLKLWRNVMNVLRNGLDSAGYEEYRFPTILSGTELRRQAEVKSFEDSVFWVEGKNRDFFLRPTGECSIYPMFRRWITSYRDLPIRVYQDTTFFRPSHKRQIFFGKREFSILEGHTAHSNPEEAEQEALRGLEILREFADFLCLPCVYVERPVWGNQPLNERIFGVDCYLPNGETVQIGCSYYQGQILSRLFGLTFRNEENKPIHTHQTTLAASESTIGAYLLIHSDKFGFRMLPEISPTQAVLLVLEPSDDVLMDYARRIGSQLEDSDIRYGIDTSGENIGRRLASWEKKGVPVRIEIGNKEQESSSVTISDRLSMEKREVPVYDLNRHVLHIFSQVRSDIGTQAQKTLGELKVEAQYPSEIREIVEAGNVAQFYWCGNESCGRTLDSVRGEILGWDIDCEETDGCMLCGAADGKISYFSRRR